MPRKEIIFLIIFIIVSVILVYWLLKVELKAKSKKKSKEIDTKPIVEEVKEEQPVKEKEVVEDKKHKSPEISIALMDELTEFQEYLKERIVPENKDETRASLHSYEPPKINNYNYDSFNEDFSKFDDMDRFSPYSHRRGGRKDNKIEELPNHIKILMMSDFFDPKF